MQRPLRGVIPPIVTPLLDQDRLDIEGFESLLEHILSGGVQGIFVLGSTGEAPSLGYRLRRELIDRCTRQVKGRAAVLVGITDTAFTESVQLAEAAAEAGADAVVLSAPYYFHSAQAELLEYVEQLVAELPLPVFLYNMPGLTKVSFDPATVERASQLPGVIGLKDSSSNMVYLHKVRHLLRDRSDFTLLVGPDELLAEAVLLGAHGGVNGGANLAPRLYVDLYEAARAGDLQKVAALQARVVDLATRIYGVGGSGSSWIQGIKCALCLLGICDDFVAWPFRRFGAEERQAIREGLAALGLLET